jgi:PilZ domain
MLAKKPFGKLGNRSMARISAGVDGSLVLPERSSSCHVENLSRKGCRLLMGVPPRVGATVIIRVDRIDALGRIVWVRGQRCGIAFERDVPVAAIERVRWAAEHAQAHATGKLSVSTAVWR